MSEQWQIRRGTTQENDDFTGAQGELTMDTQTKGLRVHDGTTQGGIEVPTAGTADYVVEWQAPTSSNNYKWYRKYKSGWVEQGQYINTANTTITFPIEMANTDYCLVGVGFCIANYGRQSVSKSTTGFSTSSAVQVCETNGYACYGMAA